MASPRPSPPEPLPRLPGPKFAPFTPSAAAEIEFIEQLGRPAIDMDSFVWKVRINGMPTCYALKMFRFNSHAWLSNTVGSYLSRELLSPQRYLDYFDPFSCKCRAYGRLLQEGRLADLAVRAHGYLVLSPAQEAEVAARGRPADPRDWDDAGYGPCSVPPGGTEPDPWGRADEPLVRDRPVHAIVKDLVPPPPAGAPAGAAYFGKEQVGDMWRDMEALHALGILVRDVKVANYLGGKLVDFSRAWTAPHPALEAISARSLRRQLVRDPAGLRDCVVHVGDAEGWDWGEVKLPDELLEYASGLERQGAFGPDPRAYEWRRWEEDLEAVDAFLETEVWAPVVSPPPEEGIGARGELVEEGRG